MTKQRKQFNATLVFIVLGCAAAANCQDRVVQLANAKPEAVGMSSAKLALVDQAMDELIDDGKLAGGIVIIARRGKVVHHRAYGHRDLENKLPMETDTIVRIYSMTKAITTAAAMMLVEEGKLKLDEPISTYLPDLKHMQVCRDDKVAPAENAITVRDLMRHTAGLSYGGSGKKAHDRAFRQHNVMDRDSDLGKMVERVAEVPLVFEPGTDWMYGISIDVLGRLVEVGSGKTLDDFFATRIFQPLGMRDTAFFVPDDKLDRFAVNYNLSNGKLSVKDAPKESRYRRQPALLSGGGGLVSTSSDYMRFLLMIANGGQFNGVRLLKEETVAAMTTNQVPKQVGWIKFGKVREGVGFGLGFSVREKITEWDPHGRVGEYGWGGAASTHYWVSPKDDDLIVVTLEQVMPYSFGTEFKLKGLIYDSILPNK